MMKMIWNLDKTVAVPLHNIKVFEIEDVEDRSEFARKEWYEKKRKRFVVVARYKIVTGMRMEVYSAEDKNSCIDYINNLEGYL